MVCVRRGGVLRCIGSPSVCSCICSKSARSPLRNVNMLSWEGMRDGGCAAIVRRALRDVPGSAVEIHRSEAGWPETISHLVGVASVLVRPRQADTFRLSLCCANCVARSATAVFWLQLNAEAVVLGGCSAELIGPVVIANCSKVSCARASGTEGVC